MVERKRGSRDRYDSDDDRSKDYDSKRRRSNVHIIKLLCPYYIAGAVIGKGGERIREVKDRSGANIEISRHEARFPNTDERVIAIEGERDELQSAARYLNENMREGESTTAASSSSRSNDYDSERRKKTCKILVSDSAMAMIIGRGGDNIRDIKKEFAVQINTSKRHETPRELDERIVTIEGEDRDVDKCVDELICQISSDDRSRMKFFVDYSEIRHYSRGRGGGGGGGGGGYGGRDGGGGGGGSRYRGGRGRSRSRSRSRGRRSRTRSKERRRSPSMEKSKRRTRSRTRSPVRSPSRSRSR